MDGIIRLTDAQRKSALEHFRFGENARISRRARILLLLDRGASYREIMNTMFCGSDLVSVVKRRFMEEGLEAAVGIASESAPEPEWSDTICDWVANSTPQDFGYFRTRWSCKILSEVLFEQELVACSGETVRRWMHRFGFAWRRPRPIVGPSDPFYSEKMQRIRRLLRNLPPNEIAVFQDEVDINLNPKIGSQWMARGLQAEVETPGNNRKLYLSGSLVWATGSLLVSEPSNGGIRICFSLIWMICEDDYADTRGSMSSATTHRFTNRSTSKNIWEHGTIASKSISSQPTRRKRTRSNVCGGIFMKRSLATIAVQPWRNWPHSPVNGSPPITTTMRTCGTLLRSQHSAPVNLWSYLTRLSDSAAANLGKFTGGYGIHLTDSLRERLSDAAKKSLSGYNVVWW